VPNGAISLLPHRDAIATWLKHWQGRRVPHASVANLDYRVKERRRLAFLERIVREASNEQ
jgi:hypothetical protein